MDMNELMCLLGRHEKYESLLNETWTVMPIGQLIDWFLYYAWSDKISMMHFTGEKSEIQWCTLIMPADQKAVGFGWKSSNNYQDPRKSWRDTQDIEKFLDLGMSIKMRTSKRSSWKLRGLVLKVQVNNWTWDRSAKFWNLMCKLYMYWNTEDGVIPRGRGL